MFNGDWEKIIEHYKMARTIAQIRGRYSRIKKKLSDSMDLSGPEKNLSSEPPTKKQKIQHPTDPSFSVVESLDESIDTHSNTSKDYPDYHSPILQTSRMLNDISPTDPQSIESLKQMLIELSIFQMKELQQKVLNDRIRLGESSINIYGQYGSNWIEGKDFIELNERQNKLEKKKRKFEQQKKQIKGEQSKLTKSTSSGKATEEIEEKRANLQLRSELNRCNIAAVRKEEAEINSLREKLNSERQLHYYHTKLVEEHKQSSFSDHRVLKDRYLLLNLLGKDFFNFLKSPKLITLIKKLISNKM